MALVSPGSEITIIDESQYLPAAAGPVPLIIAPSAQNKTNAAGTGTAAGTLAANANKLQLVTSQRELATNFGVPNFVKVNGAVQQGNELNEYGLLAAYSFLGVAGAVYVMRPDVDLAELTPSASAPTGASATNTYWLDTAVTSWGLLEWDAMNQVFTAVSPMVITDTADIDGLDLPLSSIGKAGDYAVTVVGNVVQAFYKGARSDLSQNWARLGTDDWKKRLATVSLTPDQTVTIATGDDIDINGETLTLGGTATLAGLVTLINANGTLAADMKAFVENGKLVIYSAVDLTFTAGGTGDLIGFLQLTTGDIFYAPKLHQAKHTVVPGFKTGSAEPRPSGSVWFKTTSPNNGASVAVKRMSTSGDWTTVTTPLYAAGSSLVDGDDNVAVNLALGSTLSVGSLYMRYDVDADNTFNASVYKWTGDVPLVVDGTVVNPTIANNDSFKIYTNLNPVTVSSCVTTSGNPAVTTTSSLASVSVGMAVVGTGIAAGTTVSNISGTTITLSANATASGTVSLTFFRTYTVTVSTGLGDTANAAGLVTAFSRANVPNMEMQVNVDGTVSISHLTGGDFYLDDGAGDPLLATGILTSGDGGVKLFSNWADLTFTPSASEPRQNPANGTLWYNSLTTEVDIMVRSVSGSTPVWVGYKNKFGGTNATGPTVSASEPDVTSLVDNDLWIDVSDLENYPLVKRLNGTTWETLDNTDQTTENGILFADARYSVSGAMESSTAISDLLTSNYIDLDAPDPALYPEGMLLFNTRRSGYNVKEYVVNKFTNMSYPDAGAYASGSPSTITNLPENPDAWVSKVATRSDGAPYMGRKAQRRVIVEAMQSALNASTEARREQNAFTLMAAPGYPELVDEMITLNTDRKGTAFILVDPPFRLQPTATAIRNWATNESGSTEGEEGLQTLNEYAAVFYPNAYTTNLTGESVMVPASHVMLRTIALNDQVAYPWFAPAGLRRGVVNNATSVGYLSTEGEFVPVPLGQDIRDIMYQNRMNPILIQPTGGIVVWGQKTLSVQASALDRVNVARLIVFVRKQLEELVQPYFFEPNDQLTRNEAKQAVETFLNELVGLRALYDYLVVCDVSNNTPERIDRSELWIDIAIKPVKAVEFIYIPIRVKNTGEALA